MRLQALRPDQHHVKLPKYRAKYRNQANSPSADKSLILTGGASFPDSANLRAKIKVYYLGVFLSGISIAFIFPDMEYRKKVDYA